MSSAERLVVVTFTLAPVFRDACFQAEGAVLVCKDCKDYKETLNLPVTNFPMRANLAKREPEFLKFWQENDIYRKAVKRREGARKFIFLSALSGLGVAAGEALVLEDSYNGIRAAHRAGIRSVMAPDLLPPTPEMESLFYRRADDLFGVIPLIEPLI